MIIEYNIPFIKQEDFEAHVKSTISQYSQSLKCINLKRFNSQLIDPIKLLFDKTIFNKSYDEIIKLEIHRQRDKSNNNVIGYFHQNLFKYIKNCTVPKKGWDIIFKNDNLTYYIEMKNKHNTMNSSSSAKTYIKMQSHLLNAVDKNTSICSLVEVIAKRSQNIPWIVSIDGVKQTPNPNLRRISIDKFFELVTGIKDAFKIICMQLPNTIEKIILQNQNLLAKQDTVINELKNIDNVTLVALYKLAFETYEGFSFKIKEENKANEREETK
ncbi:Eco47II family restriction endonuclease [Ureaplasma canigenitalium]|uniref:Eco47II family restriction endonuclease n=1 Tax=Ureaplasma canigenitalium TaxID=42092 RepID=UPI0006909172|nr:Eco47II family restriction endonuclease [Ureaplasma canigenitalium]